MIDLTAFDGHTPGPWNYVTANAIIGEMSELYGQAVDYKRLANARLIIAAPDLLAEVKRLRKVLENIAEPSTLPFKEASALRLRLATEALLE